MSTTTANFVIRIHAFVSKHSFWWLQPATRAHTQTHTRTQTHTCTHAGTVRWQSSRQEEWGPLWSPSLAPPPLPTPCLLGVDLPASLTVWQPWSWCEAWPGGTEAGSSWTPSCPGSVRAVETKSQQVRRAFPPTHVTTLYCFVCSLEVDCKNTYMHIVSLVTI